ncbi:hypothetical protein K466DRAFT_601738 [Polyporus arcularius HHB13444]|uniref:Uncharacterized protein n=1 Tax=Polyporus arcularius HHB13444 TaxID=1314778 RepID=A0A5C3P688_9APHY|nr:hypothetical protein K466DRAFT_601738 [Polyporus arcularius HHB13444]
MIRQRLCEIEQELEDRDALKSHPEDMRILFESFASVKAEFQPLDGQSWDTPEGRERLAKDEAARNRANHLTPARAHRLTSRRSRASIKSSTVNCRGSSTASGWEPFPTTDAPDLSSDDITLFRPTTPSPHEAAEDDSPSRDLQRTPLPSFYRATTDGDRMVISLEHPDDDADADADTTFYAELATPQPVRADDQRSPWLMRVPRHPGRPASPQKSPSRLPRPTRNPQDRRKPSPVFSNPKSSAAAARAGSSTAPICALRTPSKPAKVSRTKSRTVLGSSPTTNYGPVFTAPAPPGPGTTSQSTSPQKRPAPGSSSTTTHLPIAEAWWVEKSRPAKSPSRVVFPRTEDPAQPPTRPIPARSQNHGYGPVFSRPSERSAAPRPTSPSKRSLPSSTSTTTRRPGTNIARSLAGDADKSRPVKREPPSQSHTPVFFPRTEDPIESDCSTGTGTVEVGALPERHRTETIKASSSRTRKSSQSHGSGSRAKAWV